MVLTITHKGLAPKITSRAVLASTDGDKSADIVAMWDTGATHSMVSDSIAKNLQLKSIGIAQVTHVAETIALPMYMAAVEIQGGLIIRRHKLVSFPPIHAFDMIIGMDIITLGRFCIENKNGNTVFSFRY